MSSDPRFEVNDDGTAKDPVAFRQALREDAEKLKIIEVSSQDPADIYMIPCIVLYVRSPYLIYVCLVSLCFVSLNHYMS